MKVKDVLEGYDYDLPLRDALNDPELSAIRRILAGTLVGEGLDTAYFAVQELCEAYAALWADARQGIRFGEGYLACEAILTDTNPLQMSLWHLTCERDLRETVGDMVWLRNLAYRRGAMARAIRDAALPVVYVPARNLVAGKTAAMMMDDQPVWT